MYCTVLYCIPNKVKYHLDTVLSDLFIHHMYSISYILLLLDNDVLETSKRRAMFYTILSQIFIVKCFTKSLLI